jgi:ribosome-binding protein aMBF1 (putative translation factor)
MEQKKRKTKGSPNEADKKVSELVRLVRSQRGMSQETLAERLDLTFQQVQFFFEDIKIPENVSILKLIEAAPLLRAWDDLPNDDVRSSFLKTIRTVGALQMAEAA